MEDEKNLKEIVKNKYAEIAVRSTRKCCCGSSNNKIVDYTMIKDDYSQLEGYLAEADIGLGCGLPTEFADIKKGDIVVDLGSGAGNDVFVARAIVGEEGKVIGIDFTDEMIIKANFYNDKLGYKNVEFKLGDIEALPLDDNFADVIISNCVLNLVPNKQKAFSEIYRVLKKGGHFCVSDIVINGEIPAELKKSAEMYAGCVAGAIQKDEYLKIIKVTGFSNVQIRKTKTIELPEKILKKYLNDIQIIEYKKNQTGIFSITVTADKI
jgi:ubiquinone/menaquinone biosynthesis C-methylase UbiE